MQPFEIVARSYRYMRPKVNWNKILILIKAHPAWLAGRMEESSMVLVMDSGEVSEEEDEVQRKQELHQLLSEQLQDDLLDDSVSTITSPSLSPTPHSSPTKADTSAGSELNSHAGHVTPPLSECDSHGSIGNQGMLSGEEEFIQPLPPHTSILADSPLMASPPSQRRELSNVFTGTSQAYRARESRPAQSPLPSPSHTLQQLEVLYRARGRQIQVLTQQMAAQVEEGERQVRVLRHEKVLVEGERDSLRTRVSELESEQGSLGSELESLRGQLVAEQARASAVEGTNHELSSRLQAAEASVESLTSQVGHLASSEALSRVRESYGSALAQASEQHQKEVQTLRAELDLARNEGERTMEALLQVQGELHEVRLGYETRLGQQERELAALRNTLQEREARALGGRLAQQLDYGEGEDGRLAARVVELSALTEDLQFQLSTAHQQHALANQRTQKAESLLSSHRAELSRVQSEAARLVVRVEELERAGEERARAAEEDKRAALEQCRLACLRLHEDSTLRLRESVTREKERMGQEHSRLTDTLRKELAATRDELTAVREEYVRVCGGREEGEGERERATAAAVQEVRNECKREREAAVAEALRRARAQWLEERDASLQSRVDAAVSAAQRLWLEHHRAQLEKRGAGPGQGATPTSRKDTEEKEREVGEAVGRAREQWEREHSLAIQTAIRETKLECESDAEVALASEREKWGEERRRGWERERRALLATAHKEWSKAQEPVTRAEVEHSRRGWEEEHRKEMQAAVDRVLAEVKQQYEGERERMAQETRALQDHIARLTDDPHSKASLQTQQLQELLHTAMTGMKRDLQELLQEVLEESSLRNLAEVQQARQTTARAAQEYYLQCLHQLVNSKGRSSQLMEEESNIRPEGSSQHQKHPTLKHRLSSSDTSHCRKLPTVTQGPSASVRLPGKQQGIGVREGHGGRMVEPTVRSTAGGRGKLTHRANPTSKT